jgi:hypothetical protein
MSSLILARLAQGKWRRTSSLTCRAGDGLLSSARAMSAHLIACLLTGKLIFLRYAIKDYTVKKRLAIFPSTAGILLTNSPWPGIVKFFLARESLISDIAAGDRTIDDLFNRVLLNACILSRR